MAITPIPPLDRTSQTFRNDVDVFFGSRISNFVSETNALAASLNSMAAGGVFSFPYIATGPGSIGNAGGGKFALDGGTGGEAGATILLIDTTTASGAVVAAALDSLTNSSSSVKASVRLIKQGDTSSFLLFNVLGVTSYALYRSYSVLCIGYSSISPFTNNDTVFAFFQPTGDKGNPGSAANLIIPTFYVRDERAQGTDGGSLIAGMNKRTLNTVKANNIPGASLSNSQVTVPPGTYNFYARASAHNVNGHRVAIWNVTANSLLDAGSSEFALDSGVENKSELEIRNYVCNASTTFEVRHYVQSSNATSGGGRATNLLYLEAYAEFIAEKVA